MTQDPDRELQRIQLMSVLVGAACSERPFNPALYSHDDLAIIVDLLEWDVDMMVRLKDDDDVVTVKTMGATMGLLQCGYPDIEERYKAVALKFRPSFVRWHVKAFGSKPPGF